MTQRTQLYNLERNLISVFAFVDSMFDEDKKVITANLAAVCELMLAGDFVCSSLNPNRDGSLVFGDDPGAVLEQFRSKWSCEKWVQGSTELRAQIRALLSAWLDVVDQLKDAPDEEVSRKALLLNRFLVQCEHHQHRTRIRDQVVYPAAV